MSDMFLSAVACAFLSGVMSAESLPYGLVWGVFLLAGILFIHKRKSASRFEVLSFFILVCAYAGCFALGFIRYERYQISPPESLAASVGKSVTLAGKVSNDPVIDHGSATFILSVGKVGVRISATAKDIVRYNDAVVIRGVLRYPENFQTDQGTEFDYVSYLAKDHVFFTISRGTVVSVSPDAKFSITRAMYSLRHGIEKRLFENLPDAEAGFIAGILLGTKASIDKDLYNALIRTSTVHMIALSGYNVSIVATSISEVFGRIFSPALASFAGALGIVLFVIMTGGSSTAIRAACMALLVIFSRVSGRPITTLRLLSIATLGLVWYNPAYLVADVSFQLSFLALLGLILVAPSYIDWLVRILPPWLAKLVGETCAAETAVMPFIIYKMGIFSTVSLPVNILTLSFIPYLMFGGFALICVGYIASRFALVLGYPVYLLAHAIIFVIEKAARFPFAAVSIPETSLLFATLWYMILVVFFVRRALLRTE